MRRYCQHLLQKLSNNGGVNAATEQKKAKQYAEPFKADKKKVIALAIEKAPGAIRIGGFFPFYASGSKGAAWWGYDGDSVCLYLTYRFYSGFVSKKPINSSKSRRMSFNLGLLF